MALASIERELLEMALRPLGALGAGAEFPQDEAGIEALIGRLAEVAQRTEALCLPRSATALRRRTRPSAIAARSSKASC
jgi:hypothetical protein